MTVKLPRTCRSIVACVTPATYKGELPKKRPAWNQKSPKKNKKDGVCYAVTGDGLELPVIDITHPAFAFSITADELDALIENMQRSSSLPPAVLQSVAQKSILFRGLAESAGTFTTGMMTYLNKLEPDNLGDGYATPVDRQWAASLTPVTFRWRMRHVARLLADGAAPALSERPSAPLHLINIAGGPAMDSLNALDSAPKRTAGPVSPAADKPARARPGRGRPAIRSSRPVSFAATGRTVIRPFGLLRSHPVRLVRYGCLAAAGRSARARGGGNRLIRGRSV